MPAVWAIGASALLHTAGLTGLGLGGLITDVQVFENTPSHIIEAGLLPATMVQGIDADLAGSTVGNLGSRLSAAPFNLEPVPKVPKPTVPKPAAPPAPVKPMVKPQPKTPVADQAITPDKSAIDKLAIDKPATDKPTTDKPTLANTPSVNADNTTTNPQIGQNETALAAPQQAGSAPPSNPAVAAASNTPSQLSTPSTQPVLAPTSYKLPTQLKLSYAANARGLNGKATLNWRKTVDTKSVEPDNASYEADLTAAVTFFKTFQYGLKSSGSITRSGITPLKIEERRTNGSTIAITVEPQNKRVIISSQEGFQPYTPGGQDLLGLMLELGIFVQTQSKWSTAGTAYDFTVYRPSGVKKWRFQSQGMQTIEVAGKQVPTVHIKRIAADNQPDYEDQQFLWLDPARYGFPVKMRWVDNKQNVTDILMTEWQETE